RELDDALSSLGGLGQRQRHDAELIGGGDGGPGILDAPDEQQRERAVPHAGDGITRSRAAAAPPRSSRQTRSSSATPAAPPRTAAGLRTSRSMRPRQSQASRAARRENERPCRASRRTAVAREK